MREVRISGIRRVLRVWTRARLSRDVDDEIRFHLDARAAELMRLGISEREARRRARDEYGDVEHSRRELLRVDRRRRGHSEREELLVSLIDDVRHAARGLVRRPALLLITTTALCIGIAANAIMFGVVDQLLLRAPSGIVAPDEVKRIYLRERSGDGTGLPLDVLDPEKLPAQPITSYPLITALQEGVPALSELAGVFRTTYSLGRGARARSVDIEFVTGNYLRMLGVTPVLGRGFAPGEDTIPQGARVAVASHGFWRSALGSSREAIGRSIHVAGHDYTIIGVAPERFSGIDRRNVDLWIPISAVGAEAMGDDWYLDAGDWWVRAVGRVAPGATVELAEAQATAVFREQLREWKQEWRDSSGTITLASIVGARSPNGLSADARVSLWLMGVSAIVLLIACANVANLLIARALDRRREIAVRLALGVSRGRLVRLLLTEAALLAAFAAAIALVVAYWGAQAVQAILLPDVVWSGGVLDGRVLGFTLLVTALCIALAGAAPALQSLGFAVSDSLKAGSRQVGTGRGTLRQILLGAQAAMSIVLLIGAGLFVRSLHNVQGEDVGVDLDRVFLLTIDLADAGFEPHRISEIWERARQRLERIPEVERAVLVSGTVPMRTATGLGPVVPGAESVDLPGGGPYGAGVSAEFFPALGARIVRGRNFLPEESRVPSRVMIVNEAVANAYWPSGDAVGQCVTVEGDDQCSEIVGIAQNVMLFSLVGDERALIYLPHSHPVMAERVPAALLVRGESRSADLGPVLSREVQRMTSDMPHVRVRSYADLVAPQLRPWRLGATMFTLFGVIALLIAAVGLYSVMAYWVAQRTQEIGVRMALGAQRDDIVRMVAWQTSRAVIAGLLVGGVAAALASGWLADLLYGISPRDPFVYGGAAAVLAIAALIAGIVPARRSTAVDPALALRAE